MTLYRLIEWRTGKVLSVSFSPSKLADKALALLDANPWYRLDMDRLDLRHGLWVPLTETDGAVR